MVISGASQLGRLVYIPSDDTVDETDASDLNKVTGNIGMLVAGSRHSTDGLLVDGETVTVLFWGPVWLGDASLDPTLQYFCADQATGVDGRMADAAGTVTRRIGAPLGDEELFFNGVDVTAPTS